MQSHPESQVPWLPVWGREAAMGGKSLSLDEDFSCIPYPPALLDSACSLMGDNGALLRASGLFK